MTVLIADDDPMSRNLLRFQLEQWGHTVLAAENGSQAWELFQAHDCELVITDWLMPGLTGIELLQRIRAANREQYTYVVLLTSISERQAMLTGMAIGADDFLTKPVEPDELRARLQPSLRITDLERRLAERHRELEKRNKQLSLTNARMKRDLDAASKIQRAFLPHQGLDLPDVKFAWNYTPCTELAGDMLNVLPLDDEHIAVYVLDVSGHGVQAALLAVAASRYLSRHQEPSSVLWQRCDGSSDYRLLPPAAVAGRLNENLTAQDLREQYFTLIYGILNSRTGEFRYTVAGHPPAALISAAGEVTFLPGDGLPIGITETDFDEHLVVLKPGDRLVLYSDGLVENMNDALDLFGNARLLETLQSTLRQPLDAMLSNLVQTAEAWRGDRPADDDLSLLTLEFAPQWPDEPEDRSFPTQLNRSTEPLVLTTTSASAGWRS